MRIIYMISEIKLFISLLLINVLSIGYLSATDYVRNYKYFHGICIDNTTALPLNAHVTWGFEKFDPNRDYSSGGMLDNAVFRYGTEIKPRSHSMFTIENWFPGKYMGTRSKDYPIIMDAKWARITLTSSSGYRATENT